MTLSPIITAGELPPLPWLEVINPLARLGQVRHALFDFDGTISVIRRGWEQIMIPLMVEMICEDQPPSPEIEAQVEDYVDLSTGILTIKQMEWLEQAVVRHDLASRKLTARQYKTIYNERLLQPVRARMALMEGSGDSRETLMIAGVRAFLEDLQERGVSLYLASGSDHVYVVEEATALGVADFFDGHIYGARDDTEAYSKDRIIYRILDDHDLAGEQLLVVGDGPVEIRHARDRGALALGIAADEELRQGLDSRKRQRLLLAGADLLVTDFLHHEQLAGILAGDG
ncbi:MAG: HAD family hydrolase [Chloroflexota bacterium]|nr:HAD family hydrolase [Chloroflexota bacterium]